MGALLMRQKAIRKTANVIVLIAIVVILYGVFLRFTQSSDTVALLTGCIFLLLGLSVRLAFTFFK
jgi:hypothetical protein